ncbi:MAG: phosphate propanoyltransferase [Elusimicrobia bacterium]|nr:phosphate propanoyltransferase [Elusimicrobiota bacterium]
MDKPVICNISNRHVHLTREAIEALFGSGYELRKLRDLVQPGEYAARETIDILGPRGTLKNVRVLGPARKITQAEISRTDSYRIGIEVPVRESGDIKSSGGARFIGPKGSLQIKEGVIVARRHIHMTPADAEEFNLADKQEVRIRTAGSRSVVFENVLVRVSDKYRLECHIDTDEANSCDLKNGDKVFIC